MADPAQRYRVIERLEAGGMAEVFLGEQVSLQGFKKRVAIKRVLPHLAQNKNFIAMFLDEARLGARLNHANVVTVFDIGAADNTYFIVMEYVDGVNLKVLIETVRKQGRTFPVKEAIYLCMETCRGLSFAHELTDEDGQMLNLVHRDVSPPNILISKRGEVKVTDFGLAKAATQLEKTDPGVVKGKFSYLSPEAALGQNVDARADVFAVGIVLWEMLAGRRLFLGETDYQTIKLVQQANIPSLQRLNAEVDPEFEELITRALARDRDERHQSARELGDALAGYLFRHQMKVTSYDIANLVKSCLVQKAKDQRAPQNQSIIDRLIQEELLRFTSLDEMTDPLEPANESLSPDASEGAQPLDAGSFENPAEWFADDADVAAAMDRHETTAPQARTPGWRESGVEGAPTARQETRERRDSGESQASRERRESREQDEALDALLRSPSIPDLDADGAFDSDEETIVRQSSIPATKPAHRTPSELFASPRMSSAPQITAERISSSPGIHRSTSVRAPSSPASSQSLRPSASSSQSLRPSASSSQSPAPWSQRPSRPSSSLPAPKQGPQRTIVIIAILVLAGAGAAAAWFGGILH